MNKPQQLLAGLRFPEGSRWHENRLYFSDMHTGQVLAVHPDTAEISEVAHLEGQPSGLGWTADGNLVVSSMLDNKVYEVSSDGALSTWADVSSRTAWPTNELCVSPEGHAYLGGFGYDFYGEATPQPGQLWHINPDGTVSLGADGFEFPNGTVVLPGTNTLVVAETWGHCLTAFDIATDGSLTNRRQWAKLWDSSTADGITVDRQHGIWISSIVERKFVRVVKGGDITDEIALGDELAVDCSLGGADGHTLFLLTSNSWYPAKTTVRAGRILQVRVETPGPRN